MQSKKRLVSLFFAAMFLAACIALPQQAPPAAAAFSGNSKVTMSCFNASFERTAVNSKLVVIASFKNEGGMLASGCGKVQATDGVKAVAERIVCSRLLFPGETQAVQAEVAAPIGASPSSYACSGYST